MPAVSLTYFKKNGSATAASLTSVRRRSAQNISSQAYVGVAAVSNGYTFDLPLLVSYGRVRVIAVAVVTLSTLALNGTSYWGVSLIDSAAGILVSGTGISNQAAAFTALTAREMQGNGTILAAGDVAMIRHVQVGASPGAFPQAFYSVLWEEI